jgi:hypothetical protein
VSQLWNSLDRRYEDAAAVFAAHGRLIEADGGDAIILVNGQEEIVTPATLVTAAMMMDVEAVEEHGPEYCESCGGCKCHVCHCDEPGGDTDEASAALENDNPVHNVWAAIAELAAYTREKDWESFQMDLDAENSTTSGGEESTQTQERTRNMNFHNCSVTQKYTWAGADGYCKHCRPVETVHTSEGAVELTAEDVAEITAPTLADLIEEVGGETALQVSIEVVRRAKQAGRRGDSISGRKTRQLLDLIGKQATIYQGALLDEYREFLAPYGIGLDIHTEQDDRGEEHLVAYHDYAALKAVQLPLPQLVPALNEVKNLTGDALREYLVQADRDERRAQRAAQRAAKRAEGTLVMHWVKREGREVIEEGRKTLGQYTEEIRAMAAEYQAAGQMAGYSVTFQLV